MEKRSAARELAFLALFQLPQKSENVNTDKLSKMDLHAICLSAIRTLADHGKENIKSAETYFIKAERALMEHQIDHEANEGLNQASRSVAVPQTEEFIEHLDKCYQGIALMRESLQVPELYWHYNDESTKEFTLELILKYINNKEEVENLIKEVSQSWKFERIQKIERKLIELGAAEMLSSSIPHTVVVSEIIKLANKYSTEEGIKFINGVLADVVKLIKD
ncbi:MAG: transcription antitermination factor NusB [Candidatus Melainabacteria bacterium]|jgi:transcription antitermination protein NusB|nr:transcription antitermination factor NusB [Candidatus Melainabacteria bacterium]